ncbi:MAG: bifunctional ([pyruvate, phosphate dikinase] phosphate) phosphotransferase/[pyruvate, phosphate dikinase] kinase [Bdellovibrionaceae bacterium]|nr:bifunctional ([pyruvate, phosphate dikinase] phosphate) phosphotransferase/[pyruvate, phosphate dikinase] kinase [Pseudobdellovibrionaceae bacterium]
MAKKKKKSLKQKKKRSAIGAPKKGTVTVTLSPPDPTNPDSRESVSRVQLSETEKADRIIIVSDGTGETAFSTLKAAMVQFMGHPVSITRYKNVRSKEQIEAVIEDALHEKDLIVSTIVSPDLRLNLSTLAQQNSIICVDLLGPLLVSLGQYLGYEPSGTAGLLRNMNEKYFQRIEAMEYTIAHDDGRDLTGLEKADLVILGISRTSKTPLSMYLSHQGWKVANIPLIKDFQIPEEIKKLDQRRIIALTIDPEQLTEIRRARLQRLGQRNGGEYADPMVVDEEIEYASQLFKKNRKWPVFNVTGKALEETASEIIRLMTARGLAPQHILGNISLKDLKK